MPPLVIAATAAIALALSLFGWVLLVRKNPAQAQVLGNLTHGFDDAAGDIVLRKIGKKPIVRRLTPAFLVTSLERRIAVAGRSAGWPLERLLMAKVLLAASAVALGGAYAVAKPGALSYGLTGVLTVVGYFAPDLLLMSKGQERQKAIGLELADTLDQMTIAVAAGLAFESAMMRAAKNGKGPLAEELTRTLQDMRVGMSRREAYQALADRTTVPDLRRFLRAVTQADAYGVAITDVLRTQAAEMRLKRRQNAETKAMKIPVKVIFPLMLCILPVLFIVLLGPAAMDMAKAFSGN